MPFENVSDHRNLRFYSNEAFYHLHKVKSYHSLDFQNMKVDINSIDGQIYYGE